MFSSFRLLEFRVVVHHKLRCEIYQGLPNYQIERQHHKTKRTLCRCHRLLIRHSKLESMLHPIKRSHKTIGV